MESAFNEKETVLVMMPKKDLHRPLLTVMCGWHHDRDFGHQSGYRYKWRVYRVSLFSF